MKKSLINVQADPSILANLTIEGLARPGEAVDRDRDVLVDGTDDDDASHDELLCFGGVGRDRVDRSGGLVLGGQDAGSGPKLGRTPLVGRRHP